MSSDLYRRALGSLSEDDKEVFEKWLVWLQGHTGVHPDQPTNGAQILENFQAEAHLVGDGAFGDPTRLTMLLRHCAACLSSASEEERHFGYETVCLEFAGLGLRILREHLPDELLRYTTSRTLAATLVQRMLGKLAREAFDREALPPEVAFTRVRNRWSVSRLEAADRLRKEDEDKVFATFEHPGGAPRGNAVAMSRALALPLWQWPHSEVELLELAYPTDAVDGYRFPTVADAVWIHLFRPAPEEAPDSGRPASCYGWTEPLGAYPPQPEIVHDNALLKVLSGPPRFVGSVA
ncbi:MAG: hypothetical protein WAM82_25325 [Thermoanaerobaculia bacterium]